MRLFPTKPTKPSKAEITAFVEYSLIWYSEQFAVPFWVIGHVHLHLSEYPDLVKTLGSAALHLMVALGFWIGFRKSKRTDGPDGPDLGQQ